MTNLYKENGISWALFVHRNMQVFMNRISKKFFFCNSPPECGYFSNYGHTSGQTNKHIQILL